MRQAVLLKTPAIPLGSLPWAKLEHARSLRMQQVRLKLRVSRRRRPPLQVPQELLLQEQEVQRQGRKAKQRKANPTPVKPTSSSCCARSNSRIPRSVVVSL